MGSPELLSLDNVCSLEEERRLWSLPLSGMRETVGWNWVRESNVCVCVLPTGEGVLRVCDLEHSELVSESEEMQCDEVHSAKLVLLCPLTPWHSCL